jgi:phage terminase large subunit GpA-like protein
VTATLDARAARLAAQLWRPREVWTGSQWADTHGWIARSSGASEGGPYSTARAPYMAEILDVMCDEVHADVVFNKPAQVGFTEAVNQAVAFYMAVDPSGVIVIQPNDGMAKAWMKERVDPMLAESPALRGIVRSEGGRRTSDDTMQRKVFRGGWLVAVGANAPSGLRSRPARRVLGDERSGWTLDARNQGDPWDLAGERTATFWNKKRIQGSTPGERGLCPITAALAESDRRRYHVACPACGALAPMTWRTPEGDYRLVCDRDAAGQLIPETARYLCTACGVLIPHHEKHRMLAPANGARWVPEVPGRPVVGFDLNGLYSPWRSWADIMRLWRDAQRDPERMKVFVTHVLAEPHYVQREQLEVHTLAARAEPMGDALPEPAAFATLTVDVQKDRLETLVQGWGPRLESWVWEWAQWDGDPTQDACWQDALAYARGLSLGVPLRGVAMDFGYLTATVEAQVAAWTRQLARVRVLGVHGVGGPGRPVIQRPVKAARRRTQRSWAVGTDTVKDALLGHGVLVPVPPGGPGAVHFRDTLDQAFYGQLTAESPELVRHGGRFARVWRKADRGAANEALDLMVYGYACAVALTQHFGVKLERPALGAPPAPAVEPPPELVPGLPRRPAPRRGFVTGWKAGFRR